MRTFLFYIKNLIYIILSGEWYIKFFSSIELLELWCMMFVRFFIFWILSNLRADLDLRLWNNEWICFRIQFLYTCSKVIAKFRKKNWHSDKNWHWGKNLTFKNLHNLIKFSRNEFLVKRFLLLRKNTLNIMTVNMTFR
jgi:hypothetical protein